MMLIAEAEPRIYDLERGIVKQHAEYDNIVIMTEETWQDYIAEIKKLKQTEIVRCKDCEYAEHRSQMPNQAYCHRDTLSLSCSVHDDDDYCKWAKMKGAE